MICITALFSRSNTLVLSFQWLIKLPCHFSPHSQNGHTWAGYYQKDPWSMYYYADMHEPENAQFIHDLDERFYKDVAAGNLGVWSLQFVVFVSCYML